MQSEGSENPLADLTAEEADVLISAAVWYAKYHSAMIGDEADDPTAKAVVRRERYIALISGLRKTGVRIALPDELREALDRAA